MEEVHRWRSELLYGGNLDLDDKGRIRIDDWEMRDDVQEEVDKLWQIATTENLSEIGDLKGYSDDFFNLFGFKVDGVDYDADVNEMVEIPSEN